MAKHYKSFKVNSKYTTPEGLVVFDFYKQTSTFFDSSYYILNVGEYKYPKIEFQEWCLTEKEEYIERLISFLHIEEFDNLTKAEFDYIKSKDFDYIRSFLEGCEFHFNHNYTSVEFKRKYDHFTINDVGKFGGSGNSFNVIHLTNPYTFDRESYYIGKIVLGKYENSIKIPVVNAFGSERIEVKEFKSTNNIFKCLCFALKINLLDSFLKSPHSGVTWEHCFSIGSSYSFNCILNKFNYYKITL